MMCIMSTFVLSLCNGYAVHMYIACASIMYVCMCCVSVWGASLSLSVSVCVCVCVCVCVFTYVSVCVHCGKHSSDSTHSSQAGIV